MYGWTDCQKQQESGNPIVRFFACAPVGFDKWARLGDFYFNRSFGGWLRGLIGEGFSPLAFLVPAFLLFFAVFGPIPNLASGEAWLWFLVSLAGLVAAFRLTGRVGRRWLAALQIAWLVLVCLVVGFRGEATQASGGMYIHLLLAAIVLLLPLGLGLARWLSWRLAKSLSNNWGAQLSATELFESPPFPKIDGGDVVRSLIHAPLQRPVATLLLPGIVVLLRPDSRHLWWYFGVSLGVAWLLSSFAGVHRRVDAIWAAFRRVITVGGQGILTVLVLLLAGLRLAGVTYATTVLDQVSWSTLIPLFLAAYAFFWFYEYWTNRFLSEDLLALVGEGARTGRIDYPFNLAPPPSTKVPSNNRYIAIHAAARFAAVRDMSRGWSYFQFYERSDLFDRLKSPTEPDAAAEVSNRVRVYFGLTTAWILLLAAGFIWVNFKYVPQEPAATFSGTTQGVVDLRGLMQDKKQVVLLAASGGGTRAAMYTTALMRGMHEIGALKDVVLLSGVSGGGVSLAYFAGHREALMSDKPGAWKAYGRTVGEPFIQEVLQGFGEWRIARGVRTGKLLQESFERHFNDEFSTAAVGFRELPFGMIFNTALAGSLDLSADCYRDECAADFAACAHKYERLTTATEGGGRLIFTNLRFRSQLDRPVPSAPPDIRLPFVVVNDLNVTLTDAAALHANFPPVFPNAPVDDPVARKRYWVTDGGTIENRGIVSVLLALRDALENPNDCEGSADIACPEWPQIHVVLAEASGGTTKFSQDRGVNTALAGRVKYANQVIWELMQEVQRLSGDRVQLHYFVMPRALNIDGGLDTHWMRQERIVLGQPSIPDPDHRSELEVEAANVFDVVYNLYRGPGRSDRWYEPFDNAGDIDPSAVEAVRERVLEDADYLKTWQRLVDTVRSP